MGVLDSESSEECIDFVFPKNSFRGIIEMFRCYSTITQFLALIRSWVEAVQKMLNIILNVNFQVQNYILLSTF